MPQQDNKRKAPARTLVMAVALAVAGLVAFGASMLERTSTPSPQAASSPAALAPTEPNPVKPVLTPAPGDQREARRVEIRMQ